MTSTVPELTDSRILLRPLTDADAPEHLAGEDEEQVRWLSGQPATIERVRAWISANERDWRTDGPKRNFGIIDLATGALVGNIEAQLALAELKAGEVNIAYATFPSWRGRGIATRAVRLITEWLVTIPTVYTAVIRVHPDNAASVGAARAAGFVDVGVTVAADGLATRRFEQRICDVRKSAAHGVRR